ncbi:MAG: environmental stress-induced protein Ves [Gammaproteobacteria bacterium]|jgi:environmental stress-induced protein Ves
MQFNIISPDKYRSVAWKNGKGITEELVFGGSKVDNFDWRLSMAPVISSGDFSDFKHYDRTLILINGNGLTLDHDCGQRDVLDQRFDMAHFDGGWRTSAKLHHGDILDFNVMTRQSKCRSKVTVLGEDKNQQLSVKADLLLIYSVESDITVLPPDSSVITLRATHLFQTKSAKPGQWVITGGPVVCIEIQYVD